jgi:hypothetical protein
LPTFKKTLVNLLSSKKLYHRNFLTLKNCTQKYLLVLKSVPKTAYVEKIAQVVWEKENYSWRVAMELYFLELITKILNREKFGKEKRGPTNLGS